MGQANHEILKKCDALRVPNVLTSIHRILETLVLKVKSHNEYMLTIGSVKEHTCEDSLAHDMIKQSNLSLIYRELQSLSMNFERSCYF